MNAVVLAGRLSVQTAAFLVLAPVQFVAERLGWTLAARIPVTFHRLFLKLFDIRVEIRGTPPDPEVPTLVLANHLSWLDIPVIASVGPLSFIAKQEVAGWPVFGLFARLQRCIFLDRTRKAATAEVNALVGRRLAAGDLIVLFPEGTTADGNRILPFRSSLVGAARAALTEGGVARIDLKPLAIAYTRRHGLPVGRAERPRIAWYGDMELAPHLADFVHGGPLDAVLVWGEAIPFGPASDRKAATAAAEASIRRAIRSAPHAEAPAYSDTPTYSLGGAKTVTGCRMHPPDEVAAR